MKLSAALASLVSSAMFFDAVDADLDQRSLQVASFGRAVDVPAGFNLKCTDPEAPDCIPCEARDKVVKQRIRREVRDMPAEQWDAYVFCMWQMKTLSMAEGQEKYGPLFKNQEWFVTYHAVAVLSARGDQGHGGAIFMSFHGTFLMLLETTLITIAEAEGFPLDGLPYWWNLDDPSLVFSEDFFGSHPGLGPNYEVTDGAFADWPITSDFTMDNWESYLMNSTDNTFEGNNGLERASYNTLKTDFLTAFPLVDDDGNQTTYTGFDYDTAIACVETPYDPDLYTISNFTYCMDNAGDVGPPNTLHSGTHAKVGGGFANPFVEDPEAWGDLSDPVTSPNAPIFAPFHAFLDLWIQEWKYRNNDQADVTWGFPYANLYDDFNADVPLRDGVNGNETISSTWPAYWKDIGWATSDSPDAMRVATHVQAHCYLSKDNADYVYVRYSGAPDTFQGGVEESDLVQEMAAPTTAPSSDNNDENQDESGATQASMVAWGSLIMLALLNLMI